MLGEAYEREGIVSITEYVIVPLSYTSKTSLFRVSVLLQSLHQLMILHLVIPVCLYYRPNVTPSSTLCESIIDTERWWFAECTSSGSVEAGSCGSLGGYEDSLDVDRSMGATRGPSYDDLEVDPIPPPPAGPPHHHVEPCH